MRLYVNINIDHTIWIFMIIMNINVDEYTSDTYLTFILVTLTVCYIIQLLHMDMIMAIY